MSTTPRAPRRMSHLRLVAQGLVEATTAPTPAEAVRRQLAIQGQQVSSVPHAIVSRAARAGRADVEEAFEAGQLVRSWPMRGTVHITTAADHHWLRVALVHRLDAWARRCEESLGIDDALLGRAAGLALAAIAAEGPLRRARLLRVWREGGLMGADADSGAGVGTDAAGRRGRHLLVRLQCEGVLVQGPRRGNEHLVVGAAALPAAQTGPGGPGGGARGTGGHRAALAEIARRYATSHGPVGAADLARWTALPLGEAARALADALELTNAADYVVDPGRGDVPLTRALADDGERGAVRVLGAGARAVPAGRAPVLYMRADLPDLLAASRGRAAGTHFLAAFDEVHAGYKDRACLTDAAGERLICPAGNGMFRPLLVDRGRVVAVRPAGAGLLWADDARRSARLERDVERAVRDVERRLARPVERT